MCETISLIAGQDLVDHKLIALSGSKAIYANALDALQTGKVLGISINSCKNNKTVIIQIDGKMCGFNSLIIGPYFVGINGNLSNSISTYGFIQRAGIAISNSDFIIRLGDPIIEVI